MYDNSTYTIVKYNTMETFNIQISSEPNILSAFATINLISTNTWISEKLLSGDNRHKTVAGG